MEARQTFDKVADLYAKVRQGYPAALYGDLGALGALSPSMRMLEVGCGAGQATVDLANKVRDLIALDPGAALIEAARQRLAQAANVAFVVSNFEDYAAEPASFDLIVSAQAWHWIPPQIAYPKAADALTSGGWLAVFGHVPMPPPEPFAEAFKAVVEARFPGAWGQPPPQAAYLPTGPFAGQFDASGRSSARWNTAPTTGPGPSTARPSASTCAPTPATTPFPRPRASSCSTPWPRRSMRTAARSPCPGRPTSTPRAFSTWM